MIDVVLAWFSANQMALWFIVGIVCMMFEMISPGLFFFLSFFFGSLGGALATFVTTSWLAQSIVFLISSLLAFVWLQYWVKRRSFASDQRGDAPTNVHALQGQEGIVVREVTPDQMGQVKVGGETWSARPADKVAIKEGAKVIVVDNRGAHVVVREVSH